MPQGNLPVLPLHNTLPRRPDLVVFAADPDIAEQGAPRRAMTDLGLRRRQTLEVSTSAGERGTSPSSTGVLTPASTAESLQTQDTLHSTSSTLKGPLLEDEDKRQTFDESDFIVRSYHDYTPGLPQMAAATCSDERSQMHRGFNVLNTRLLQRREIELTQLEEKLFKMDQEDAVHPTLKYRLTMVGDKPGTSAQHDLLDEIDEKMGQYLSHLLMHSKAQALGKVSETDHKSFSNWFWTNGPLQKDQDNFILHSTDFVRVHQRRSKNLEDAIEDSWLFDYWPMNKFLRGKKELEIEEKSKHRMLISNPTRLRNVAHAILVATTVVILLVPVYLLDLVPMSKTMMFVTVACFIVLFSFMMALVAGGDATKLFLGTATYGAVLIVFLGNFNEACPA